MYKHVLTYVNGCVSIQKCSLTCTILKTQLFKQTKSKMKQQSVYDGSDVSGKYNNYEGPIQAFVLYGLRFFFFAA